MIRHVVMWKFQENTETEMHAFLKALKGLEGKIPGLRSVETGVNCAYDSNFSAILICEFDTLADLEFYQKSPIHLEAASLGRPYVSERSCVDYEL